MVKKYKLTVSLVKMSISEVKRSKYLLTFSLVKM